MLKKILAAATLACASLAAHSALLTSPDWDTLFPNIAGVQFNSASKNGVTVSLGAHAYKNGVLLPNDNAGTYRAQPGTYPAEDRANWSFDFLVNAGTYCLSCLSGELRMDKDPGAGQNFFSFGKTPLATVLTADSWNLEMDFLEAFMGNFDPNANGIYDFMLSVYDADDADNAMVTTNIRVVVGQVPEPGSLALVGVAILALGYARRRQG